MQHIHIICIQLGRTSRVSMYVLAAPETYNILTHVSVSMAGVCIDEYVHLYAHMECLERSG